MARTDDMNVYECSRCPLATFADQEGMEVCTPCPGRQTTALFGSTSMDDCQCPRGFYLDSDIDRTACMACGEGLDCPFGSDMANFRKWKEEGLTLAAAGPQPQLLERYWSSLADPLKVYQCELKGSCPGGPPETCRNEYHADFVCARCVDGYLLNLGGECRQCSNVEASQILFPTLPLLVGPLCVSVLYLTMRAPVEKWTSDRNQVMNLFLLAMYHYQMVYLAQSGAVRLPSSSSAGSGASSGGFIIDLMALISPECLGLNSFQGEFAMRVCIPLILLGVFAFTFFVREALALCFGKWKDVIRMNPHVLFCCFMSLMFTFHLSVVALSVKLFMCYPHPEGRGSSLIGAAYIKCYEDDEWWNATWGAVAAICIYCLSMGAAFVRVLYISPRRFNDANFRLRWKFLLVRFQPNCWWWGIGLLLRGIFLNITVVLWATAVSQLVWVTGVITIYTFLVVVLEPWRYVLVNMADVLMNMLLLFTVMLFQAFSAPKEEQEHTVLQGVLVMLVVPLVPLAGMAVMPWVKQCNGTTMSVRFFEAENSTQDLQKTAAMVVCADSADVKSMMMRLTPMDRYTISRALHILQAEILGNCRGKRLVPKDKLQKENVEKLQASLDYVSKEDDSEASYGISLWSQKVAKMCLHGSGVDLKEMRSTSSASLAIATASLSGGNPSVAWGDGNVETIPAETSVRLEFQCQEDLTHGPRRGRLVPMSQVRPSRDGDKEEKAEGEQDLDNYLNLGKLGANGNN